ncbi:phosphotyrosine protein phosphatase [Mesorhizobium sp. LSHC440A00]|nr:phosphotyrosine protein phosphatase [Mesorhizobium sp. LSHC440A00]
MNAVRSPMAEQLARRMLPPATFVASAGVHRGERDPFVDAVLAEEGLTLGERQPRSMDDLEDDYFDLIVTLAPEAHHAALELTRSLAEAHHAALELTRSLAVDVEYWPMPDPTDVGGRREQIMASYRDVRERLKARISRRFLLPEVKNAAD